MSSSSFVKSTLLLTTATLLSKILGSIFRIPLQNIAGDHVLGIFSLVYPVYMVALTLSVAGIPIAISKLIADARAQNQFSQIKEIYVTASILAFLFGLSSFLVIYGFSSTIAEILGGQSTRLALIIVAATLLIAPYMAVYRGYFQGFEDMKPTAISQVMEQFVRVGLILLIAYYLVQQKFSDEVVAGGVMIGSVVGAFISLVYLKAKYIRSSFKQTLSRKYTFHSFTSRSKHILTLSIPIAIGTITMALINFIDSITIPYGLRNIGTSETNINYLYGIYGRGLSVVQIATVFSTSVVLPLIPLITSKLSEGDTTQVRAITEKTYRVTHILSWPAAAGLLALTLPMNLALFTDLEGNWILAIIGCSSVFTSLTILSTGILQGLNLAKQAAMIVVIGVFIKAATNIYLIQLLGLAGAAVSTLVVYIILFIINTWYIYKHQPFRLMKKMIVKINLASLFMAVVIGAPTLFISVADWTRIQALVYLTIAIVVGVGIYIALLLLMKVINVFEILQYTPYRQQKGRANK
ncbi:putative polysaccharide biosynthesis protein [Virgibacillus pantothenticus]|uniref:putative polysaccharide biosynthesis protein n=1 Tax=Virgibacillus pantothenticus TaxID=1473 RepID=UPI0009855A35|nr:polysaccharide biosynthesis protein [Virgibacillus pantothenticus]